MAYIVFGDMRDGTLYPYIDVPSAGVGAVLDARLTSMIAAAQRVVDDYCQDHFEVTNAATIRLHGHAKLFLAIPRRIRAITTVALVDYAGTSTSFDSSYWRIRTSFDNISGANIVQSSTGRDGLELKKRLTVGGASGNWPEPPWMIEVTGDYDWAATPDEVKHATALIVWSWCSNDLPPNVESVDSATVRFTRARPGADTTGVIEADILLQPLRRKAFATPVRT